MIFNTIKYIYIYMLQLYIIVLVNESTLHYIKIYSDI